MADALYRIKAFGMTNQIVSEDLAGIGRHYGFDFGNLPSIVSQAVEDVYYPQFDASIRSEAEEMAKHYEVFYCLEKSIRELVSNSIEEFDKNDSWWTGSRVSQHIKAEVASRIQKELDAGISRRSLDELDYTTFGELSDIIQANPDVFGGIFNSRKGMQKVMANLNALRNSIAHCSPLAEDEQLRLQLAVRDWFRLME